MADKDQGGQMELGGKLSEQTDEQLIKRYSSTKNQNAFRVLYERHAAALRKYLGGFLRDEQNVEDALQTTYLHVHQKHGQFRPGSKFRPWLFSIAANLAIDTQRSLQRSPLSYLGRSPIPERDVGPFDTADDKSPSTEAAVLRNEEIEKVRRALIGLPAIERQMVELIYFDGLTFTQAADRLNMPVGTLKAKMHRLFGLLRMSLADHVAADTAVA